ncbi:MAG: hypothetical protein JST91_16310 [Actinobacteria bacterium]|nr:hypothetical protein [Actinomycetota bacterium]
MPHLMQPRSRRRRTRADPWGQGGAALGVHTGPRPGSRCKAFDHADTHHTRQPFSHRIGKPNGRAGIWVGLPRVGRLERCPCAQVIPHPDDINGFVERSQKPRIWRRGIDVTVAHGVDSMAMAMSLVASTRGLALMPAYALGLLPQSVISRPPEGQPPTIDVVMGYATTNTSPVLKMFLARLCALTVGSG